MREGANVFVHVQPVALPAVGEPDVMMMVVVGVVVMMMMMMMMMIKIIMFT